MTPRQRENAVECVDSFLETLEVETFVAVFLSNCDDKPVIEVVKEVTENQFKLHNWKGTYRGKWAPLSVQRLREPWTDMLTRECIILHAFQLTNAMKLQPTTRKHLSEKYTLFRRKASRRFIFYMYADATELKNDCACVTGDPVGQSCSRLPSRRDIWRENIVLNNTFRMKDPRVS